VSKMMVLSFSTLYPSSVRPTHGIFVETRLRELLKSEKSKGAKDQLDKIEGELAGLNVEIEQLHQRAQNSKADPFWTEKIARERMNYSAPGELIFRFEDSY